MHAMPTRPQPILPPPSAPIRKKAKVRLREPRQTKERRPRTRHHQDPSGRPAGILYQMGVSALVHVQEKT
ncbi:hypothetical protein BS78_04G241700 [Paspalum vaginatum]|nr:hypothetical protein BS78_04G241700 [Paspalum vaginatum]